MLVIWKISSRSLARFESFFKHKQVWGKTKLSFGLMYWLPARLYKCGKRTWMKFYSLRNRAKAGKLKHIHCWLTCHSDTLLRSADTPVMSSFSESHLFRPLNMPMLKSSSIFFPLSMNDDLISSRRWSSISGNRSKFWSFKIEKLQSMDSKKSVELTDSLNLPIWLRMVVCTFPFANGKIFLSIGTMLWYAVSWFIFESTQGRHLMEILWTSGSSSLSNSRYLSSSFACCKSSTLKCL